MSGRIWTAAYRAAVVCLLAFVAYQQFQLRQTAADAEHNARSRWFESESGPAVQKVQVVNSEPIPVAGAPNKFGVHGPVEVKLIGPSPLDPAIPVRIEP